MELVTPKGKPVVFSPLLSSTSTAATASPTLENFKFARTTSAASTTEPLSRTTSYDGSRPFLADPARPAAHHGDALAWEQHLEFPVGHLAWQERDEWQHDESPRSPPPSECSTQTGSMGPDDIQTGLWALTSDGRVLGYQGNAATDVGASSDPDEPSCAQQVRARVAALRAVQQARAAHRAKALVESGEVCPIDGAGVLHGELQRSMPSHDDAARLKMFRAKRLSHRQQDTVASGLTVCVGPDCRARALLELPPSGEHRRRALRERRGIYTVEAGCSPGPAWAIDTLGRVQFDE